MRCNINLHESRAEIYTVTVSEKKVDTICVKVHFISCLYAVLLSFKAQIIEIIQLKYICVYI